MVELDDAGAWFLSNVIMSLNLNHFGATVKKSKSTIPVSTNKWEIFLIILTSLNSYKWESFNV